MRKFTNQRKKNFSPTLASQAERPHRKIRLIWKLKQHNHPSCFCGAGAARNKAATRALGLILVERRYVTLLRTDASQEGTSLVAGGSRLIEQRIALGGTPSIRACCPLGAHCRGLRNGRGYAHLDSGCVRHAARALCAALRFAQRAPVGRWFAVAPAAQLEFCDQ